MRKLIAGFKMSIDGKIEGPEGFADWAASWSEEYGLTRQIDACVLGGRMYPGYEQYWSAIQKEPDKPLPMTGRSPTPGEVEWARFAAKTPHYVLSSTSSSAQWPNTRFLRKLDDLAELKGQSGKDIYLMGGASVTAASIEAKLLDELRLIVYPLIAGEGKALFETMRLRRRLNLLKVQQLPGGCVSLIYQLG